jgi:hypothetical protein
MNSDMELDHVTTEAVVAAYKSSSPIFDGVLREVRELSKKKPEATISAGKVKIINRILDDLLAFLKDEPEGKYLELLDDESLPQISDAVLTMVQFETALKSFKCRYNKRVHGEFGDFHWITSEFLASQK